MTFAGSWSSSDEKRVENDEYFDIEALPSNNHSWESSSILSFSRSLFYPPSVVRKVLNYPAAGSIEIKQTSWLDGVRGVAALEVYIFHAMGCWAALVPGWYSDQNQTNILQLPVLRTFFVAGGAAVSVFFALSGYVLTHKSLRWIREGSAHQVYPSVASSMFRRGFRLYLPPIFMTFVEMIATRFGSTPPLNSTFVPEARFSTQFMDWFKETCRLLNPWYNLRRALHGFITHPKYETVVWTIPLEFYGSFLCYFLLLTLAKVQSSSMRMGLVALLAVCAMGLGSWNMFCFSGGMLIADFNLGQDDNALRLCTRKGSKFAWIALFATAFYVAGLPTFMFADSYQKPMPGFEIVRFLTPESLDMEDHARFWWSLSGVSLLLSISQLTHLKRLFETYFCQYLGKISFSLYLIHEFCILLFGLGIKRLMLLLVGIDPESKESSGMYWMICVIWYVLVTIPVFSIAAQMEKYVDAPIVSFARWMEGKCMKCFKGVY